MKNSDTRARAKPAATSATVTRQTRIQRVQDAKDEQKNAKAERAEKAEKKGQPKLPSTTKKGQSPGPVSTSAAGASAGAAASKPTARSRPRPPLPAQHLTKPGTEAEMALKPRFEAPDYKGSGKLQGFSTLVTGGDSGIGRAVAVLFAREGANVAIVYLNEHNDAELTKTHIEAEGGKCVLIPGDVKDAGFCRQAVAQTVAEFGGLDVLVNNAGFQEHADGIESLSEVQFDETLKTNVYGYFHMAKAAVPHLPSGGSIINTGSVTGLRGSKGLIDYSTTKGAIHAFTKALASSLMEKGIRVNAVAPGPVWTPFNPADRPAKEVAKFGGHTDFGRPAQPEELSPAYVFLAAPCCSSYVTGIVLPVTGTVGDGA